MMLPEIFSGPAVGFCGTFVDFFGLGIILPFLPFFVSEVEDNEDDIVAWVGGIITGQYAGVVIGSVIMGTVADKLGPKMALLVSLGGDVVFFTLSAFADTALLFFLCRVAAGIFTPVVPGETWVVRSVSFEDRPAALAKFVASMMGGFLVGSASSLAIGSFGIDVACFISAAIAFITCIVVLLSKEPYDVNKDVDTDLKDSDNPTEKEDLKAILFTHAYVSVALMNFSHGAAFGALVTIPGIVLKAQFGFDEYGVAGFNLGMVCFLILANVFIYKRLLAWLKPWKLYLTVAFAEGSFVALSALLLWLIDDPYPFMAAALAAITFNTFGVPTGSYVASNMADIRQQANPNSPSVHGRVLGVTRGIFNIGQAVAPIVASILFNIEFYAPFLLITGLFYLCLVNFLAVGKSVLNLLPEGQKAVQNVEMLAESI